MGIYPALDKCVMQALLRCPSRPCHRNYTRISIENKSPSLSAKYSRYNECTFGPRASKIFRPDEKPIWIPSSSNCPIEINGLQSSGTCQTLCSTRVEPLGVMIQWCARVVPKRLSSTVPTPIMAQCCEFPTRTESECLAKYCQNCDL